MYVCVYIYIYIYTHAYIEIYIHIPYMVGQPAGFRWSQVNKPKDVDN